MSDSKLPTTKAWRLAVRLLVIVVLCLGPYAQSAEAGAAIKSRTGGHHAQYSAALDVDDHHSSHVNSDTNEASSEKPGDRDADAAGGTANCCELFCVGSALAVASLDSPIQAPSAVIHSHADAGVALGEWATPHRPPQRLI
jgi:hypothetical protein